MDPRDEMEPDQLQMLQQAFCEQLMACLDECARGRKGLFGDVALLSEERISVWPEAARLRELALALQGVLAQQEERNALCDEFLTSARCTARATPANASWRERFWSASSGARWARSRKGINCRGNSARISRALLAGFATLAALVIALTALLARMVPSWVGSEGKPQPGLPTGDLRPYAIVNLGYSFLAAAAGGYVTAWVAAANPLIHVLALALVVLALAALSALQSRGKQPIWYALALVAISPIGVLAGGLVRLRVLGIYVKVPLVEFVPLEHNSGTDGRRWELWEQWHLQSPQNARSAGNSPDSLRQRNFGRGFGSEKKAGLSFRQRCARRWEWWRAKCSIWLWMTGSCAWQRGENACGARRSGRVKLSRRGFRLPMS
jgi:hypothetical protein